MSKFVLIPHEHVKPEFLAGSQKVDTLRVLSNGCAIIEVPNENLHLFEGANLLTEAEVRIIVSKEQKNDSISAFAEFKIWCNKNILRKV